MLIFISLYHFDYPTNVVYDEVEIIENNSFGMSDYGNIQFIFWDYQELCIESYQTDLIQHSNRSTVLIVREFKIFPTSHMVNNVGAPPVIHRDIPSVIFDPVKKRYKLSYFDTNINKQRIIYAKHYAETITDNDPELDNRIFVPKEIRRPLGK